MTIVTKYNIGDEVWFMQGNRPHLATIRGYNISYGEGEYYGELLTGKAKCSINYFVKSDRSSTKDLIGEGNIFPTKEELLKSL